MKKAFSLIELSVVILIIGILIAGVTQSSRLIKEFKMSSARNLTESSPVNSIKNLVLWLETTSTKSFLESEAEDQSKVSTWNNINPQATSNINFTQSEANNKPIYDDATINDLPAIKFNGTSSYFEKEYLSILNPQELTIFAVVSAASFDHHGAIISSRSFNSQVRGYVLYFHPSSYAENPNSVNLWLAGTSGWGSQYNPINAEINKPLLVTEVKNATSVSAYNSGTLIGTRIEDNFLVNTENNFRIGAGQNEGPPDFFLNGHIGELIIFSRALKNEERQEVEKYLGKKWGIKVS